MAHEPPNADCLDSSALSDVGQDSVARNEQVEVQLPGKASGFCAVRTTSMKRRVRGKMQTARRLASSYSQGVSGTDNHETLYTLVDGLTGDVVDGVTLAPFPN